MLAILGWRTKSLERQLRSVQAELAAERLKVKELESQSESDPVLNVFNQRGFERHFNRSCALQRRYRTSAAVVLMKIDPFELEKDDMRGEGADRLLKKVAATIIAELRSTDIVSRIGGLNFAVLLWDVNEYHARAKAESLIAAISSETVLAPSGPRSLTAWVGVTMLRPFDHCPAALARAEEDMRARRPRGKSFDSALTFYTTGHLALSA